MRSTFPGIREVLVRCGPLTMREVASHFPDTDYHQVASMINSMHKYVAKQQIYIVRWTMYGIGRKYPRPVYALGSEPDAPKPAKQTESERHKRRRATLKAQRSMVTSVWTWRPSA